MTPLASRRSVVKTLQCVSARSQRSFRGLRRFCSYKQAVEPSTYIWLMPRHVRWHRVRVGLVVALIIIFVGVVIDSLFSASWALDDGLLLAAAAVIALAFLLTRGRGRVEAS